MHKELEPSPHKETWLQSLLKNLGASLLFDAAIIVLLLIFFGSEIFGK